MLNNLNIPIMFKSGTRAVYKRSGEVVVIKEHKLPNQVTIELYVNTSIFKTVSIDSMINKNISIEHKDLNKAKVEATISIDLLEALPDNEIAELLY